MRRKKGKDVSRRGKYAEEGKKKYRTKVEGVTVKESNGVKML